MPKHLFPSLGSAARAVAITAALALPNLTQAATVSFVQHASGPVTVEVDGFDRDPSIEPGNCLGPATDPNQCASVGENLYGIWPTSTPRTGPADTYLAFLTAAGTGAVSAVVQLYWSIDGVAFMQSYFQADPSDFPAVPVGYLGITETGGPQDITDLFSNGGGVPVPVPEGLRIFAQTDAEPAPEPASMLLLTTGLLGAGLARRRTRLA